MGKIVEKFGQVIQDQCDKNPAAARKLLLAGYRAKNIQLKTKPGKHVTRAAQYASVETMNSMIAPLAHPDKAAMVSLFTPCEMLQVAGLHPYSCEGFGCYLSGTHAERAFLQYAENEGLPETFCSYHKVFIGAAEKGLMPKPRFIINTTLACDANLLTFRRLAEFFGVEQYVNHKVSQIALDHILCEDKDGNTVTIPCDYVVLAVGARPVTFDAEPLKAAGIPVIAVGDCGERAADISNAIRTAYDAANSL